jgi:hypothetical protein
MRENRPYGSEGGESGSTGLPYPYHVARSHLSPDGGGLTHAAVDRLAADGYKWHVATCRQTVEA